MSYDTIRVPEVSQIGWLFAHKSISQLIDDGMKPNWGSQNPE